MKKLLFILSLLLSSCCIQSHKITAHITFCSNKALGNTEEFLKELDSSSNTIEYVIDSKYTFRQLINKFYKDKTSHRNYKLMYSLLDNGDLCPEKQLSPFVGPDNIIHLYAVCTITNFITMEEKNK